MQVILYDSALNRWSKIVIVLRMTKVMGVGRLALPNLSGVLNKISFEAWFGRDTLFLYLCAVVMVASLILGGGARGGLLSDAILQLLAIPLLLVSLWRIFEVPLTRQMRLALWFCLAIAMPSAPSADSAAAVALDSVAEPATISRGL